MNLRKRNKILLLSIAILLLSSNLQLSPLVNTVGYTPVTNLNQTNWENPKKIISGDYAKIISTPNNEYRILVKSSPSSPSGVSSETNLNLYSSYDLVDWFNNVSLSDRDVRDFVWDQDRIVGVKQDNSYIYPYEIYLDGNKNQGTVSSALSYARANHAVFIDNNDETNLFYYFDGSIRYHRTKGINWVGSEIDTNIAISSADTSYDMIQHSNGNHYLFYTDNSGDTILTSSADDFATSTLITSEEGFEAVDLIELGSELVAIYGREDISDVDFEKHYELYYSSSSDGNVWSTLEKMTPDNGLDKLNSQLLPLDDGSFLLQFSDNGQIYFMRSVKTIQAIIEYPIKVIPPYHEFSIVGYVTDENNSIYSNFAYQWDIYFPNNTILTSKVGTLNENGRSGLDLIMDAEAPGGKYKVIFRVDISSDINLTESGYYYYKFRDSQYPIIAQSINTTISGTSLEVLFSGLYEDTSTTLWMTLTVFDPHGNPYRSVSVEKNLSNQFVILFELDISFEGKLLGGEYSGQIIARNWDPLLGGILIDFFEFNFEVIL